MNQHDRKCGLSRRTHAWLKVGAGIGAAAGVFASAVIRSVEIAAAIGGAMGASTGLVIANRRETDGVGA